MINVGKNEKFKQNFVKRKMEREIRMYANVFGVALEQKDTSLYNIMKKGINDPTNGLELITHVSPVLDSLKNVPLGRSRICGFAYDKFLSNLKSYVEFRNFAHYDELRDVFFFALENDQADVIAYLHSMTWVPYIDEVDLMKEAWKKQSLRVLTFLLQTYRQGATLLFVQSIKDKKTPMIDYIKKVHESQAVIVASIIEDRISEIIESEPETAYWILNNVTGFSYNGFGLLVIVVNKGSVTLLRALMERYEMKNLELSIIRRLFHVACLNGKLEIAKYLHDNYVYNWKKIYNPEIGNPCGCWASPPPPNVPQDNGLFALVCANGRDLVADWLYSLDSNIPIFDGFCTAMLNGHINLGVNLLNMLKVNMPITAVPLYTQLFIQLCDERKFVAAKVLKEKVLSDTVFSDTERLANALKQLEAYNKLCYE